MLAFTLFHLIIPILLSNLGTAADVFCSTPYSGEYVRPQPTDCRLILAHLPSTPLPGSPSTPPRFSLSLPYLPGVLIRHGTCHVSISYQRPPRGHTVDPALYTVPPVIELYGAMKAAGERIVRDCVEAGTRWGGSSAWEVRGVRWTIDVKWQNSEMFTTWDRIVERMRGMVAGDWEAVEVSRTRMPWARFWEL